jgi:G3E family GTPase
MYLSAESSQARLPVLLLTGFLGSGKTTLVNALLRDPRLANTAVAVNEFGEIPLDAHLIDHGADKTVVMANGCLCCNLAGDMEDAVLRLFSRREAGALPSFERLIIEPSGLSDPAPIAQAILRNPVMSRAFRLEGIIATVDALFGLRQIDQHAETAKQIFMADRLVITKTDMADTADATALRAALRSKNPAAEIFQSINGEVDPAALLPLSFMDTDAPAAFVRAKKFADSPSHETETLAITLTAEAPLNWRLLEAWLRKIRLTHAAQLLRLKAILNLTDSDEPVVIHGVHHVLHTPTKLPAWPDADRRSRIVLITRGLPRGLIEADWQDSLPGLHAARAA